MSLERPSIQPSPLLRSGKGSIPSLGSPQSLDGCYFSPSLVTDWFWGVLSEAVEELRRSPQRGIPIPDRLERNGPLTTIILQVQIGNKLLSQMLSRNPPCNNVIRGIEIH